MKTQAQQDEEKRLLLGNLNPEERANLRQKECWETCFQAWLEGASPKEVKERLDGPEEEFLRWMDAKAFHLMLAEMGNQDPVEAMKDNFPYPEDWEDSPEEELPPDLRERAEKLLCRVQG